MPWSALPEHLNSPEKWKGTDNDTWLMRWELKIKGWFAFGPRATEWWARWREFPKTLIAIGGKGPWRIETDFDDHALGVNEHFLWMAKAKYTYLSRVQYWKRWHIALQWPLQLSFHCYWKEKDVAQYPKRPLDLGIKKMFFAYGPTHRDADRVYWILSFFVGGQFK